MLFLNSCRRMQYDRDLLVDPHRSGQLRTTQRYMYSMRDELGLPERRLPELRQRLLRATTDEEAGGLRDEMRYLVLEQASSNSHQWCADESKRLRNCAPDEKNSAAAAANKDAIEILQAKVDSCILCR